GSLRALASDIVNKLDILNRPEELLDMLSGTPFVWASVAVVVGVLCVLNGYRWHRWVVVVLAFCLGWVLGTQLHQQFGESEIVSVALAALLAIIATPMLKIAVALFGGLTGAFVGANAWTAFNATPTDATWAGAAMGFIALAMASFIFFRLVIVLFTSIGGAAMVVFGLITLLMQNPEWEPAVRRSLSSHELLLPLLVAVAAVGGMVVQNNRNNTPAEQE
ncbi:MAG: hypothetical protein KC983_10725, partial [Phycisphaerales bacterium]|nr:hypothetical protein [Phycisphaerales bacterium]